MAENTQKADVNTQRIEYNYATQQLFGIRPNPNNVTVYPEEYYTGCDVSVHIGSFKVEATSLSFILRENVMPIYSYASYEPLLYSRGTRTIEGSLTIAFRESYYLYAIMESLNEGTSLPPSRNISIDQHIQNQVYDSINLKNPKGNADIVQYLLQGTRQEFEIAASAYEDAIWGGRISRAEVGAEPKKGQKVNENIDPNETKFIGTAQSVAYNRGIYTPHFNFIQEEILNGVSIYISYGQALLERQIAFANDYNFITQTNKSLERLKKQRDVIQKSIDAAKKAIEKAKNETEKAGAINEKSYWEKELQSVNIQINQLAGQLNNLSAYQKAIRRYGEILPNTVHVIRGVRFNSVQQVIQSNNIVEERYDFIASGLDEV